MELMPIQKDIHKKMGLQIRFGGMIGSMEFRVVDSGSIESDRLPL